MLRRGRLEESRRSHALDVIERNAEMQARLIDDLLDVSRIVVGQLRLHVQPVNLQGVIEAAIDAIRPAAENKALRVSSSVLVTSAVYGDVGRLQQVVWNLLTNAVKFTPSGGAISVDAAEQDGYVRIVVTDSGQGIPAQFQSRLFETFSQADASFSRPHGGLGLGLAIVRRLVEAHGGQVEADSRGKNQGSTFTVTLPLGQGGPSEAPRSSGGPVVDFRDAGSWLWRMTLIRLNSRRHCWRTLAQMSSSALARGRHSTSLQAVNSRSSLPISGCRVKTASGKGR